MIITMFNIISVNLWYFKVEFWVIGVKFKARLLVGVGIGVLGLYFN